MPTLAIHAEKLDAKTATLRALRLARDAQIKREQEDRAAAVRAECAASGRPLPEGRTKRGSALWDNIDASGGEHACHWWTGDRRWNRDRYEEGEWHEPGCQSHIARRVLVYKTYGREVPVEKDVSPLCDEYLCCNLKHMVITPHGGSKAERLKHAVPVEEYFCDEPRNDPAN